MSLGILLALAMQPMINSTMPINAPNKFIGENQQIKGLVKTKNKQGLRFAHSNNGCRPMFKEKKRAQAKINNKKRARK